MSKLLSGSVYVVATLLYVAEAIYQENLPAVRSRQEPGRVGAGTLSLLAQLLTLYLRESLICRYNV